MVENTLHIKWEYFYIPGGLVFFLYTLKNIINYSVKKGRNLILYGIITYAIGGLFFEFISYVFSPLPDILQNIEFVLEEGLEMSGVILILSGCLHYFSHFMSLRGILLVRNDR
jgi:hypothetical protein